MSNRAKKVLAALALTAAAAGALSFVVRWSRPCDEELARARETWTAYASHIEGTRAEAEARAVLSQLAGADGGDLAEALDRGEGLLAAPPPNDARGAELYRRAMEQLALADGACTDSP